MGFFFFFEDLGTRVLNILDAIRKCPDHLLDLHEVLWINPREESESSKKNQIFSFLIKDDGANHIFFSV